jgi:PhzF family phenazine biosynthesis protein
MRVPLYQVDAFATERFSGNPAAVCPLEEWLPDTLMQQIAAENNLPETAFFVAEGAAGHSYALRWFTPVAEVDLCGHATLASAHVIFSHLEPGRSKVQFRTLSGELTVTQDEKRLILDFPAWPASPVDLPDGLADALGANPDEILSPGRDLMAIFSDERAVRDINPDFAGLKTVDTFGVIVSAPGDECDFVTRFFAPRMGIDEDPVTGSAYCTAIPYWAERLGKSELVAKQLSKRGGTIYGKARGDRVDIGGHAIEILTGQITL